MNKVPPKKPVGSSGRKLQVYFSLWGRDMLWAYDEDHHKVVFNRCQQARDWAAQRGFVGIQIVQPPSKK